MQTIIGAPGHDTRAAGDYPPENRRYQPGAPHHPFIHVSIRGRSYSTAGVHNKISENITSTKLFLRFSLQHLKGFLNQAR
jgi:hypothetical protein